MISLKMFETEEDLSKVTGLSHEDLWDNGFDLDDWDVGFASNKKLTFDNAWWLTNTMDNYCCGYNEVEYDGKYYYLVYHS